MIVHFCFSVLSVLLTGVFRTPDSERETVQRNWLFFFFVFLEVEQMVFMPVVVTLLSLCLGFMISFCKKMEEIRMDSGMGFWLLYSSKKNAERPRRTDGSRAIFCENYSDLCERSKK